MVRGADVAGRQRSQPKPLGSRLQVRFVWRIDHLERAFFRALARLRPSPDSLTDGCAWSLSRRVRFQGPTPAALTMSDRDMARAVFWARDVGLLAAPGGRSELVPYASSASRLRVVRGIDCGVGTRASDRHGDAGSAADHDCGWRDAGYGNPAARAQSRGVS